jgi:colanic acid/amylovoran biosynthesis protein
LSYILITGGELFNKGAQAMTFTIVNELKSKYPQHELIVLSERDYNRDKEELQRYNFTIKPWFFQLKMKIYNPVSNLLYIFHKSDKNPELVSSEKESIIKILKNTDLLVDVSGYALSSQWGTKYSLNYLLNIMVAKKYNIPVLLLPQSFGPFNYRGVQSLLIKSLLKRYLKYPKKIFAREEEGYKFADNYTQNNLVRSLDLVLQNKNELNLNNIFKDPSSIELNIASVSKNSVAIIPNKKILNHGTENILKKYVSIVRELLNCGKKVYLIRHSYEDLYICEHIKSNFSEKDVVLLTDDFQSYELEKFIDKFDFIIASRYHSIVHAYKHGVPAIVLGWATKYQELAKVFSQENFLFDVRRLINDDDERILNKVIELNHSYKLESNVIKDRYASLNPIDYFE